jgi:hypothetical protein
MRQKDKARELAQEDAPKKKRCRPKKVNKNKKSKNGDSAQSEPALKKKKSSKGSPKKQSAPKMSDKPVGVTHPTNSFGRTIRARDDIGISSPFVFT